MLDIIKSQIIQDVFFCNIENWLGSLPQTFTAVTRDTWILQWCIILSGIQTILTNQPFVSL